MIKVYEVSSKYIMLFMHNNKYLLVYLLVAVNYTACTREIFEMFQKYFTKHFMKYFTPKNFIKFYITNCTPTFKNVAPPLVCFLT